MALYTQLDKCVHRVRFHPIFYLVNQSIAWGKQKYQSPIKASENSASELQQHKRTNRWRCTAPNVPGILRRTGLWLTSPQPWALGDVLHPHCILLPSWQSPCQMLLYTLLLDCSTTASWGGQRPAHSSLSFNKPTESWIQTKKLDTHIQKTIKLSFLSSLTKMVIEACEYFETASTFLNIFTIVGWIVSP